MKGVLDSGSTPDTSTINTLESRPVLISDYNSHNRLRVQCVFDGGEFGFDRAISKDMDNTTQRVVKSKN